MEEHIEVRRLHHVEGLSMRAIARSTGLHRATVAKILAEDSAGPVYRHRGRPRARPRLAAFLGVIEAMLDADRQAPRKQRHTAKRIFERLRDEHGYTGCVSQVRAYVAQARNLRQAAFVPLQFGPGEAQVDWGQARVFDDTGAERKAHLFVMTLPFSDARFVAAFPRESLEFFLEGHVRAFAFFGGVDRRSTRECYSPGKSEESPWPLVRRSALPESDLLSSQLTAVSVPEKHFELDLRNLG